MLTKDSIWQSSFGNWQPLFIRENFLPLGHAAWQGFITQGKGIVVCHLAINDIRTVNWSLDLVEYSAHFLTEAKVPAYLQAINLETKLIEDLMDTVQNYNPTQEMLLLIDDRGHINLNLLQNMVISPSNCSQQVQQRHSEFQLDYFTPRRNL
jgi:hypothetical protein